MSRRTLESTVPPFYSIACGLINTIQNCRMVILRWCRTKWRVLFLCVLSLSVAGFLAPSIPRFLTLSFSCFVDSSLHWFLFSLTSSCHWFISPSIIVCIVLWLYSVLDFLFHRCLVLMFPRVVVRSCSCYSVLLVCGFLVFSVYWSLILSIPMCINYSFLQFAIFRFLFFINVSFLSFADSLFIHLANLAFQHFLFFPMY